MFNLGYVLLVLTTGLTLTAMLAYLPGVRKEKGRPLLKLARPAVYAATLGLIAASATLWYLILTHQYQYDYVYRYVSDDMPLRYVISAFWGGQEGTFLLWALMGGMLAIVLRFKAKQYEAPVQFFYLGINAFLLFMLLKASPFNKLPSVPPDGSGLNPLLQDPWMTIHPPVMFFGFASLGIPAAYAMAALVKEDWDNWVRRAIPWTIFGIMALGTGLVMGGYWAYSILGWGGFWGWDPVENSSLVPWLMAIALLHNQVIQTKRGIFRRSNIFLALMPFVLLTYSTFLTRSGVLADFSVHSFTDLGINQFLVAFMVVFLGGGLALFAFKFRRIPVDRVQAPLMSREYFMFLGALSFALFGIFVLLGTSAPLLTRITGNPSNVQPEFYNRMGLPFAILIGLLISLAPYLIWKAVPSRKLLRKLFWPLVGTLVVSGATFVAGVRQPGHFLMVFVGIFAVFANSWIVVEIMRRNWSAAGGYVAHVGIGLAIIGILTSTTHGEAETVVLPQDEEVIALGYGFKYMGTREVEDGRKNAYDVVLRTSDGSHIMSPTMFFSDFNAGMMKKPAIQMFVARDIYLSPIGHAVDPLDERVESKTVLPLNKPMPGFGMELEFLGYETRMMKHEGHNHEAEAVVARIRVTAGDHTEVIEPGITELPDGHTETHPASVEGTGHAVTLLAVDTSGSHAQIGVRQPPILLGKGEKVQIDQTVLSFHGFEVESKKRGGSVKVFATVHVDMGGETYDTRPGIISRPQAEELELIEAPIGRTGLSLVLVQVDAAQARGHFYITRTPREYFYAEVSTKPFIGLLWIGTILTVLGLAMATFHRGRLAGRLHAAVVGEKAAKVKKNGKREAA
jgi:cytochrome c-type biogenesis protein CcmF